jgi:hypothetical protein
MPRQFRLRSLMIAVMLASAALAVVSFKLMQDARRRAAFDEFRSLGLQNHVGSGGLRLVSQNSSLSDSQMERLIEQLEVIQRRYDLGLSEGSKIAAIDLSSSQVTPAAVERLRQALPGTDIQLKR